MALKLAFSAAFFLLFLHQALSPAWAGTFKLVNSCPSTVWVGAQSNAGHDALIVSNVELASGRSISINTPRDWGGRFWGRTGCKFGTNGKGACITGDCGGNLQCNGVGGEPPATLAEFTLHGADGNDYYDVSLVDGYNLPLSVVPFGGKSTSSSRQCGSAGCVWDLNTHCPSQLQVQSSDGKVVACKSACAAFGASQYCCTGSYGSPNTCAPTSFSRTFKASCPRAYSYAYDDASSIFTCANGAYTITFCPQGSIR